MADSRGRKNVSSNIKDIQGRMFQQPQQSSKAMISKPDRKKNKYLVRSENEENSVSSSSSHYKATKSSKALKMQGAV